MDNFTIFEELSFLLLSIFSGRDSHYFRKKTGKIVTIFYTYFITNLVYLYIRTVY